MTDEKTLTCSQMSSQSGEHLYGTALEVKNWFLLEYSKVWKRDAFPESALPVEVKEHLEGFLSSFEESRIQLIGGPGPSKGNLAFYYAHSSEFSPKLYRFEIETYEDLLSIDLPELVSTGEIEKFSCEEKLALVCTHGAHDGCCAVAGAEVYRELLKKEGISAWRTSHVGGHRFAANMIMLPEGIYYGRVNGGNLDDVVSSHLRGEIFLDCFRGRSCYSQTSQVSDYFLRKEIEKLGIYDIRWQFEKDQEDYTSVEFGVEGDTTVYGINTVVMNHGARLRTSCDSPEVKSIPQFFFYGIIHYEQWREEKEDS
ncbi:MAG: hypothetical protein OXK19_02965 [Candidatus Dadabacteria bacterium]|nr:hypothetical protein [Candidatus Dadabacteria bacterium]